MSIKPIKPHDYPSEHSARVEREWRAYDEYYSDQTLEQPYFYHHHHGREGKFLDSLISRFGINVIPPSWILGVAMVFTQSFSSNVAFK